MTSPRARRALALLGVAAVMGAGCATGGEPTVQATATDPVAGGATNELYEGFQECPPLPSPGPTPPPDMVLPEGAVITAVGEVGPLVSADGFVDATPVDIRDAFAERDDVELVHLEDEGFEAEVLVDRDGSRTYLKATVRCRTGSILLALLSDASAEAALPVPGQLEGGDR